MRIITLHEEQWDIGDTIKFKCYAYSDAQGGTVTRDTKNSGEITMMWYDYECGYRFHVKLNCGMTVYVSEFDII